MTKKEVPTCLICCEKFNKSNHKSTNCQYCTYDVCTGCASRWLMGSSEDPHCMNDKCKKAWNYEFLTTTFTKKFIDGEYKKRREEVLFERERSLLPETQPYAENLKAFWNIEKEMEPIDEKIGKLNGTRAKKYTEYNSIPNNERTIEKKLEYYREMLDIDIKKFIKMKEKEFLQHKRDLLQRRMNGLGGTAAVAVEERRVFVRACPSNTCNGFLSSAWKCGLCEVRVCSDCHEIKETKDQYDSRHPKGGDVIPAPPHVCTADNLATANLLKADSKNCPKCAAMIFKIEGCDQMYCTQCQTAFSWRTGRIETGTIHNPHYYDFLRRQNNGVIPRNPGDVPCGGAGLPGHYDLRQLYTRVGLPAAEQDILARIHRNHAHIQHVELTRYRTNGITDNRELRAAFLIQKIDEAKFKHTLQKNEKARNKKNDIRMVLEMYQATTADMFRNLLGAENASEILTRILEFHNLRQYFNESMMPIGKRYNCVVPFISDKFVYDTVK